MIPVVPFDAADPGIWRDVAVLTLLMCTCLTCAFAAWMVYSTRKAYVLIRKNPK